MRRVPIPAWSCQQCKKTFFKRTSKNQLPYKFCSRTCLGKSLRGRVFSPKTLKRMSLSKIGKRMGTDSPRWKGGRHIRYERVRKDGTRNAYVRITCTIRKNGRLIPTRKFEHRLVMEQKLGRPLKHSEVVHHINCDPLDNRPENLMLFPNSRAHLDHHLKLENITSFNLGTRIKKILQQRFNSHPHSNKVTTIRIA